MMADSILSVDDSSNKRSTFDIRACRAAVLACPKCSARMEPMLLPGEEATTQTVWWTCSAVALKKCTFPLDMPSDVFWVKRSEQDIRKGFVPLPALENLPAKFHHLYPRLFNKGRFESRVHSRQSSLESSSSLESNASVCSVDVDERNKSEALRQISKFPKTKMVAIKSTELPTFDQGNMDLGTRTMNVLSAHLLPAREKTVIVAQSIPSYILQSQSMDEVSDLLEKAKKSGASRKSGIIFNRGNAHAITSIARDRIKKRKLRGKAVGAGEDALPLSTPSSSHDVDSLLKEKLLKLRKQRIERKRRRSEVMEEAQRERQDSSSFHDLPLAAQPTSPDYSCFNSTLPSLNGHSSFDDTTFTSTQHEEFHSILDDPLDMLDEEMNAILEEDFSSFY